MYQTWSPSVETNKREAYCSKIKHNALKVSIFKVLMCFPFVDETKITWIEFSCRLRYLVFSEILSGIWSKLLLVQMTRLAWLEQIQGEGHGGAASVSWGPWLWNHNKSWTNQRRGKGVPGLVTMTTRMATESWPTPIAKKLIGHLQSSDFRCLSWCSYLTLWFSFAPSSSHLKTEEKSAMLY